MLDLHVAVVMQLDPPLLLPQPRSNRKFLNRGARKRLRHMKRMVANVGKEVTDLPPAIKGLSLKVRQKSNV
jgi:hypothetical protein